MKRSPWKYTTLLASLLCMPLLLSRADAVTVHGLPGPPTGPSVTISDHWSTDWGIIHTEYDAEVSANDIFGHGNLKIGKFVSEEIEGLIPFHETLNVDAAGFLKIIGPSPFVDVTFRFYAWGAAPYGGCCSAYLSLGGKEAGDYGGTPLQITIPDVPSYVPLPYRLSVWGGIDTEFFWWEAPSYAEIGFDYDLRNALIKDSETGKILEDAAVQFVPAVPEPATGALIGIGLLAVALVSRRYHHHAR